MWSIDLFGGNCHTKWVMLQTNYYLARDLLVWKTWCMFTRLKSCREYFCQITKKTQLLEKHKNTKNAFLVFGTEMLSFWE